MTRNVHLPKAIVWFKPFRFGNSASQDEGNKAASPLTPGRHPRTAGGMTTIESVTTERRCEAMTFSDIEPYRCTTSATVDRAGRRVCLAHARALRICWFDDDDVGVLHG